MVSSYQLRSERHQLYLKQLNKVGLSSYVDKTYSVNAIECVPFGDYRIPQFEDDEMLSLLLDAIEEEEEQDGEEEEEEEEEEKWRTKNWEN